MANASSLPDDIDSLKRLLANRDDLIAKLMAEIARLKRWQFGRSASLALGHALPVVQRLAKIRRYLDERDPLAQPLDIASARIA